jgi:hypothetical protein
MPWKAFRKQVLEGLEEAYLHSLLSECGGKIGVTAERAGIQPRSLYSKMKRYGLRKEDYRNRDQSALGRRRVHIDGSPGTNRTGRSGSDFRNA